jgi:vestitone reductase
VTKRALDGALRVLQAYLNSKTVKRVVHTSSEAAVLLNGNQTQEVDEMDESFWSDINFLRASKPYGHLGSYMIS